MKLKNFQHVFLCFFMFIELIYYTSTLLTNKEGWHVSHLLWLYNMKPKCLACNHGHPGGWYLSLCSSEWEEEPRDEVPLIHTNPMQSEKNNTDVSPHFKASNNELETTAHENHIVALVFPLVWGNVVLKCSGEGPQVGSNSNKSSITSTFRPGFRLNKEQLIGWIVPGKAVPVHWDTFRSF